MAEYKRLEIDELAERTLALSENTVVVMHANPDGDTVGSCSALCKALRALGKKPRYLCSDEIPERLEFILTGLNRAENYDGADIVAVDVASAKQLGALADKLSVKLMIDHHEVGEPFADNCIKGGMSSCAEVIYELLSELEKISDFKMNKDIAYALYAGISSDTGSFRYSSTSPMTMRRAAELMEYGIDFSDISHKLFSTKSYKAIQAEGLVCGGMKTAFGGKVAYAVITLADVEKIGGTIEDFECAVDIVRSLQGVRISFVVKEKAQGVFRVSLRSLGEDVAFVSKSFGGGGHTRAAGCTVNARTADEAAELVLKKLDEVEWLE